MECSDVQHIYMMTGSSIQGHGRHVVEAAPDKKRLDRPLTTLGQFGSARRLSGSSQTKTS